MNNKKLLDEDSLDVVLDRLYRIRRRNPLRSEERPYSRSMRLLDIIANREGATPGDLAEIMDVRPSTVTEMLNRLEKENFIIKNRDEDDQRIVHLDITEEGRACLGEVKKNTNNRYEDILTDEEYRQFIVLCRKLRKGLEQKYSGYEEVRKEKRRHHERKNRRG